MSPDWIKVSMLDKSLHTIKVCRLNKVPQARQVYPNKDENHETKRL